MASRVKEPLSPPRGAQGRPEKPSSRRSRTRAAPATSSTLQDLLRVPHIFYRRFSVPEWGTETDSLRENPCARTPIHTQAGGKHARSWSSRCLAHFRRGKESRARAKRLYTLISPFRVPDLLRAYPRLHTSCPLSSQLRLGASPSSHSLLDGTWRVDSPSRSRRPGRRRRHQRHQRRAPRAAAAGTHQARVLCARGQNVRPGLRRCQPPGRGGGGRGKRSPTSRQRR